MYWALEFYVDYTCILHIQYYFYLYIYTNLDDWLVGWFNASLRLLNWWHVMLETSLDIALYRRRCNNLSRGLWNWLNIIGEGVLLIWSIKTYGWKFRNPANLLRLVVYPIFKSQVLYVPGVDRRISESSTISLFHIIILYSTVQQKTTSYMHEFVVPKQRSCCTLR